MSINTTTDLNLVGTSQLVDDAVTAAKIAAGAVGTSEINATGIAANYVLSADGSNAAVWAAQTGVTSVTGTAPIASSGGATPAISIAAATTSVVGAVQLSDSTSTTSSVLAATPTAVKSAYDLANGAIPKTLTTTTGDVIYASAANTPARLGIGTTNQVLSVVGGIPSWATLAASGADVQEFTSSGTWTKPAGKTAGFILAVGAGAGGAGGYGSSYSSDGATGGSGGQVITRVINFSTVSASVTVTIGAGGAGGAGSGGSPGDGVSGGNTSFGTHVIASGGEKGIKTASTTAQTNFVSAAGAPNRWHTVTYTSVPDGASGGPSTGPAVRNARNSLFFAGGGGAGGSAQGQAGGSGGTGLGRGGTGPAGGAAGQDLASGGTSGTVIGDGGGGSGANNGGGTPYNGGAGYLGGGGGGGGLGYGGNSGGTGGAGGGGYILVVSV